MVTCPPGVLAVKVWPETTTSVDLGGRVVTKEEVMWVNEVCGATDWK
jgi:hypothetical protein